MPAARAIDHAIASVPPAIPTVALAGPAIAPTAHAADPPRQAVGDTGDRDQRLVATRSAPPARRRVVSLSTSVRRTCSDGTSATVATGRRRSPSARR